MQPRHGLDELVFVEDLDDVGMASHLDRVSDESRRHRVGAATDSNRAPTTHDRRERCVARNARRRQRTKRSALESELVFHPRVEAPLDDVVHERDVCILRWEIATAAHDERLLDRCLGAVIGLLRDAVFVRFAGPNPRRDHAVMIEHGAEAVVEGTALALFELVRRRGKIVGSSYLRHAAEIPERFLNASDERFESLAECERYPSPAAEAEHKLKEQMPQQATCNRHSQIGRVREVERPLAPGYVPLLEVHFLRRTVERTPVANATLQRPKLADAETTRVALLQYVDDRGCLENALRVARQ